MSENWASGYGDWFNQIDFAIGNREGTKSC